MTAAEIDQIASAVRKQLQPDLEELRKDLGQQIAAVDKKVNDLAELVQGMVTGHAERFVAIEEHLGVKPPPRPAWRGELV